MQPADLLFQTQFVEFLQGEKAARLAPWLAEPPTKWRRLLVYRNSSIKASVQAVLDNFPVCQALLPPEQLRQLVRAYVLEHRPAHAVLAWYGQQFPDWLQQCLSQHHCPWLADLARLERCWLNSVLAAEQAAIRSEQLALLAEQGQDIQTLRLGLRPCVQLLESNFTVWDLWLQKRHQLGSPDHAPVFLQHSQRLLWRQADFSLQHRQLNAAEWAFFQAISNGNCPLGEAAAAALAVDDSFDLSTCFANALAQGLLCHTKERNR
ncbi:DNA-binding domain-containing protein [Alkalimonas amylolytica]|uniref:Putative DNA-binding domain-containing protein n=1 Tax=Alkalimonas amylolytica TaxID=152573 RepID=A0A1H3XUZ0_ALKAM|nr:DNA-binding domain-containing protein [Alkalimonas amylolytica]SEA02328.1 Putative DNA-binding domain-containing protein [Alkalimonas amylolytica]